MCYVPDLSERSYESSAYQHRAPDYQAPLRHVGQRCDHELSFFDKQHRLICKKTVRDESAYAVEEYLIDLIDDVPDDWCTVSHRRIL